MSFATILTTRKPYKMQVRCVVMFTKTTGQKRRRQAPPPISSRFLCPRPPILLSAPNQNRHATQASPCLSLPCRSWFPLIVWAIRYRSALKYKTAFNSKTYLQSNWVFSLTNLATKGHLAPTSFLGFSLLLPRGRKIKNPGNEVDLTHASHVSFFSFSYTCLTCVLFLLFF